MKITNQIAIFLLPAGATQRDFETALRARLETVHKDETPSQTKAKPVAITDNDQMPLWTWFVPNSCR